MTASFKRLTRPAIRQLRPGQKITEHDITAEKLADGDVRYSVNIMVHGRRIHRVIGTEKAKTTRHQAEQFMEQARSDARAGRLSLPSGRKLALTFAAAADSYVKHLEDGTGRNITVKRRQLRMYLKPFFGAMRLDTITKFTVDRYKKRRIDAGGAANGTINRELATLSHLFSVAVEAKWLDRRPCKIEMLKEDPGRIIALSDEQCEALMRAGAESANPYCSLFIAFGLNTAMRHSEILAARFDLIDFGKLRLFVPDAKAGQREQPITPELADLLRAERETRDDPDGWIFPSPHKDSGTGHRARMDGPFDDAVARAGLDPLLVTPHVMGIPRSPSWFRLASTSRRSNESAATKPWRGCCAMCTCMASMSTAPFVRSGERCLNLRGTDAAARLHRNYTRGRWRRPEPGLSRGRN